MPPPGDGFGGYPAQQYDQYAGQEQQPQQAYEDPAAAQQQQPHDQGHKKKKRGYAAQAFEVGTGANAVAGAQTGGAPQQFGAPPAQPGYGGYQAEPQAAAPQGYQYPQGYGAQQPAAPQAPQYGYQAPDQGYPAPGAQQPAPGVGGITQGVGNMNIGGQAQQPQAAQPPRPAVLNQLYPTDLLSQPFNVSELDLPPPPIVLPPNVSCLFSGMVILSIINFHLLDECYSIPRRQLLPAIFPINSQRCSHHPLAPEEVQAAPCARHPALRFSPRR